MGKVRGHHSLGDSQDEVRRAGGVGAQARHTVSVHPGDLSAWTPIWLFPIGTAILTADLWTSLFRYSRNERLVPFEA